MPRYVGFLRAVNVGRRQTPMARVRSALEAGGYTEVQTYIQTGNVLVTSAVLSPERVAAQIQKVLTAEFGFDVPTIVRIPSDLPALVAAVHALPDPFPGGRTYAAFLASEPDAESRALLDAWAAPGEWARVVGRHVVMRLGVPAHESTLTNAKIERYCGTATTRDLTVVRALADRWGG